MDRPLTDIKVIDLGHVLAGPTAATILADLGADVVHLEPPSGDDSRAFPPFVNGESGYFASVNRNKRSMVVDLKNPQAKEVFLDLVRASDVIIENFRPSTMGKLGLAYESLQEINPRIIYASISGFGHDALPEYSRRPSYDMIAQAFSGVMSITGTPDGPPVRVGTSIGDILSGHQCAIGILAALWERSRSGVGQAVDISMTDGLVYALENAVMRYTSTGVVPGPLGNRHPSITPFQGLETRDGWIVIALGNNALWQTFCNVIKLPELAKDERFCDNDQRTRHQAELTLILEKITKEKDTADWVVFFEKHDLPFSKINTIEDIVNDPNIRHRRMIVEVDHPHIGKMKMAGSPFRLSRTPAAVVTPAPLLAEHTEEVLRDFLGYSKEKIDQLISDHAVGIRRSTRLPDQSG